MTKGPMEKPGQQTSNVITLRERRRADSTNLEQKKPHREPSGRDVATVLLECAPARVLTALELTRETRIEWSSFIESSRTAREHLRDGASRKAQAEALRARFNYSGIAGLALAYAFLKPAWRRANRQARDTVWQFSVPYDVLMQFGDSLRCEIEELLTDGVDGAAAHSHAIVQSLRSELDTLKAAEVERGRKFSDAQRRKAKALWSGSARERYLPLMLQWRAAHPGATKDACADHFHPKIVEEFRAEAPMWETVRGWLKGK